MQFSTEINIFKENLSFNINLHLKYYKSLNFLFLILEENGFHNISYNKEKFAENFSVERKFYGLMILENSVTIFLKNRNATPTQSIY